MKKKVSNEPDVFELLMKMQEQLAVLDRKFDSFMTKSLTELAQARAVSKPALVQQNTRLQERPQARPMFRATCADCQKECELPFKPSGERPVYCKECFAKRRNGGNAFKPAAASQPQAVVPAQAAVTAPPDVTPSVTKKKRSPAMKKPAAKSVAKKKSGVKKKK